MEQKIVVRTKGQLLAAFQCAICSDMLDSMGWSVGLLTHITLIRKTGITVFELNHRSYDFHGRKVIRKMRRLLRRIPARELIQ